MTELIAGKWETAGRVARNIADFADAAAVAAVSIYSLNASLHHKGGWYKLLLVASVLIALQAFWLFVRHFNYTKGA
jgi:hypothetical protein